MGLLWLMVADFWSGVCLVLLCFSWAYPAENTHSFLLNRGLRCPLFGSGCLTTNKTITTIASATKKINGALYRLNTGVQVWTRRGKAQLVARIPQSDGRVVTQFFEMSAEGVRLANNAVNQAASEVQTYGTAFGSLSALERHAVEVYRAYVKECIGQGVGAMPLQDVLDFGLKKAREVTSCVPTFGEVVPKYMEYLKKNASAKHCEIRGIMLRKICRTWGNKRLNLFTEEDVNAYLAGLQGRHGGEPSP